MLVDVIAHQILLWPLQCFFLMASYSPVAFCSVNSVPSQPRFFSYTALFCQGEGSPGGNLPREVLLEARQTIEETVKRPAIVIPFSAKIST